jgi:transcriptional regulator with XRE-family HTH domain
VLEVKRLRQSREWNQTELAYHAGLAPSVISQIENGKRSPSARTLGKLAEAFGVEVADLFPKAETPLWSEELSERDERWSHVFREWLQEHNARRILMTDEEVVENLKRLASGSDRQAIVNRFEQEARKTFEEEDSVESALRNEWWQGGSLLPQPAEGPGLFQRASARHKEHSRLQREVRRSYGRYYRALEAVNRSLFHAGRINDFVILNKRPQTVEAIREATRALQEEAHENARGA